MDTLSLPASLKRGAMLVTANWPVVVIDFASTSLYKLALSIPVFGGSLVVATLIDADVQSVIGAGVRATADLVVGSLSTAPVALAAFLLALGIVAVGGEAVLFIIKSATFSVIVTADRRSGDVHRMPVGSEALARASLYSIGMVLEGGTRFGRRAVTLALWLGVGYACIGALYIGAVSAGLDPDSTWSAMPAWPLLVFAATAGSIVVIAVVNLAYDLLRVIVVTDDCSVRSAVGRLRRFVVEDARQVVGIFAVICGVQVVAALVSLLATAGLAIVGYVPLVSLVFVPLQAAAWVLRGVLFEALALSALASYQTQYRRFSEAPSGLTAAGEG
jgi:hypothetical protein